MHAIICYTILFVKYRLYKNYTLINIKSCHPIVRTLASCNFWVVLRASHITTPRWYICALVRPKPNYHSSKLDDLIDALVRPKLEAMMGLNMPFKTLVVLSPIKDLRVALVMQLVLATYQLNLLLYVWSTTYNNKVSMWILAFTKLMF